MRRHQHNPDCNHDVQLPSVDLRVSARTIEALTKDTRLPQSGSNLSPLSSAAFVRGIMHFHNSIFVCRYHSRSELFDFFYFGWRTAFGNVMRLTFCFVGIWCMWFEIVVVLARWRAWSWWNGTVSLEIVQCFCAGIAGRAAYYHEQVHWAIAFKEPSGQLEPILEPSWMSSAGCCWTSKLT